MMETTARFDLPLLAVAQAAKEMTVNEALTRLDMAVQPVVEGVASAPPSSPASGQGWLVGSAATGAFAGHGDAVAVWTAGGWRFVVPFEGMAVWRRDLEVTARKRSSGWFSGVAVALPTGGATIDTEARATITAIVARMSEFGIMAE